MANVQSEVRALQARRDHLLERLWDGHRKIAAARAVGRPATVIEAAERRWCDLLAQLNRTLCELGELEPTYTVDGRRFVTYGCERPIASITLLWPAGAKVATIGGQWRRLETGEIEATYTHDQLELCLAAMRGATASCEELAASTG